MIEARYEAKPIDPSHMLLIVVGSHLRAEMADRPLAYRLQEDIIQWQHDRGDLLTTMIDPVVCNDLWYLNTAELHDRPTICLGGPGVNALSGYFLRNSDAKQAGLFDGHAGAGDGPTTDPGDATASAAADLMDGDVSDLSGDEGDGDEDGGEDESDGGGYSGGDFGADPGGDEKKVLIQIDPEFTELRTCIWGTDHALTVKGLELFKQHYLDGFLRAVATQVEPRMD